MLQEAVAKLERALRGEPDEPHAVTRLAGFAALMRAGKPEQVRIADLQSDEQYQRPIDREKVTAMRRAKAYRDPIKVNRRPDGSLWIVDGQHRAKAAEEDGLTHVRAWVADMPQQEEQHHETGVMKQVKRIPAGDSRRGRIHPGEFTGDDLAERDDEDTVGVTPYRGSAPPTEAYFDSPRWKHFITFAKQQASELGVSVDAMRKGTGMWMGEMEPTSAWYVHDHDQVTTWAARVGEEFNQDAVAVFHEDDYGRHRLYQFTGIHPQRAMAAAERVGLPAATVTGGTLTVIATDDKTDTRVLALAEELGKTPHSVAGRAQFIPREEYGRYAAADEASDEGEGAGDLPGGQGAAAAEGHGFDATAGQEVLDALPDADRALLEGVQFAQQPKDGKHAPAEYDPNTRTVHVQPDAPRGTIVHELGHAKDHALGWMSQTKPWRTLVRQAGGSTARDMAPDMLAEAWALTYQAVHEPGSEPPTGISDDMKRVVEQVTERPEGLPRVRGGWHEGTVFKAADQARIPAGDPRRGRIHPGEWTAEEARAQAVAAHEKAREEGREKPKDEQTKRDERASTSERRRLASSTKVQDLEEALAHSTDVVDEVLVASRLGRLREASEGQQMSLDLSDIPALEEAWEKARDEADSPNWANIHRRKAWREKYAGMLRIYEGRALQDVSHRIVREQTDDPLVQTAFKLAQQQIDRRAKLQGIGGWEGLSQKDREVAAQNFLFHAGAWWQGMAGGAAYIHEYIGVQDEERLRREIQGWMDRLPKAQRDLIRDGAMGSTDVEWEDRLEQLANNAEDALTRAREAAPLVDIVRRERAAADPVLEPQTTRGIAQRVRSAKGQPVAMFLEDSPLEDGILYAEHSAPLRQGRAEFDYTEMEDNAEVFGLRIGSLHQYFLDEMMAKGSTPEGKNLRAAVNLLEKIRTQLAFVPLPEGFTPEEMDVKDSIEAKLTQVLEKHDQEDSGPSSAEILRTPLYVVESANTDYDEGPEVWMTPEDAENHSTEGEYQEMTLGECIHGAIEDQTWEVGLSDEGIRPWMSSGTEEGEERDAAFGTVRESEEEAVVKAMLAAGATVRQSDTVLGGYDNSWAYKNGMEPGKVFAVTVDGHQVTYLPHTSTSTRKGVQFRPIISVDPATTPAKIRKGMAEIISKYGLTEREMREAGFDLNAWQEEVPGSVGWADRHRPIGDTLAVETPEPLYIQGRMLQELAGMEALANQIEELPHKVSFEGKPGTLGEGAAVTLEQAKNGVKANLKNRNHDMIGASKTPIDKFSWGLLFDNGLADIDFTEPEEIRMADAGESGAPLSERGKLRVEGATPAQAVKALEKLGLTTGLAEQVPYNVLYRGSRRLGRVQPRHPDFLAHGKKVDLTPGKVVIHGLTAREGYSVSTMIENLIESGGVQSTSERRRVGIDVTTESVAGDTGSGLDQYVFCTYGSRPQFGRGAWLILKPTVLERRDVAFAPNDFGGGQDRFPHYTAFAEQIGQGKFTDPPDAEARNVALSRMDAGDAEVLLKHSIPWEDVDTLAVEGAQYVAVKKVIEKAKREGKVPEELRVVRVEDRTSMADEVDAREQVLRAAYEAA